MELYEFILEANAKDRDIPFYLVCKREAPLKKQSDFKTCWKRSSGSDICQIGRSDLERLKVSRKTKIGERIRHKLTRIELLLR